MAQEVTDTHSEIFRNTIGNLQSLSYRDNKLTPDEFNNLYTQVMDAIVELDDQPAEQNEILEVFFKVWEIEDLTPARTKIDFLKKNTVFFDDTTALARTVTPAFTKQVLNSIQVEDGSLISVCGAGEVRSKSFVEGVKALESEKLLVTENPNMGLASFITRLREFDSTTNKTLVMFTNTSGFEVLTLITKAIEIILRDQSIIKDKRLILNVMRGDLSCFGIENFVLIEKNA